MRFLTPPVLRGDSETALALHRYVIRFAASLAHVFLWVLLFEYFAMFATLGSAFVSTCLLYALAQTISVILVPFAMRRMRGGMLRGVVYGTIVYSAAFVYFGSLVQGIFPNGIVIIGILLGIYGALYRVPYSLEQAASGTPSKKSLSGEALLAAAPLISGLFLASFTEPQYLFFAAGILTAISLIPLLFVPNVHEDFEWQYLDTFAQLISIENRQLFYGTVWRGIIGTLLMFVVPIVLLLITQSTLMLAALYAAILLSLLLFRASRGTVIVVSHADGGAYLDEYTALKEMGISLGRLCAALCVALCAALFIV